MHKEAGPQEKGTPFHNPNKIPIWQAKRSQNRVFLRQRNPQNLLMETFKTIARIEARHQQVEAQLDQQVSELRYLSHLSQQEIKERKRVETELLASEKRYRSLFEDSPVSMWEEDFSAVKLRLNALKKQGISDFQAYLKANRPLIAECVELVRVTDVNKATLSLFRAEKKDLLLKNLSQIVDNDSLDLFSLELVYIMQGKTEFSWEGSNQTLDGQPIDVSMRWSAMPGSEESLSKIIVSMMDISERKRSELALLKAQAQLEQRVAERTAELLDLYDNAPCGYHSLDDQGRFVHINKTELGWLGYTLEQLLQQPIINFMTPIGQARFAQLFPTFKKNGFLKNEELEFKRQDGSALSFLVNATAILDQDGNFKMSRSTLIDISQRKKDELALREKSEQLSAANAELEKAAHLKEEFLASMSHELRTPLTGILGLSEALQMQTYGELSEKQLKTLKNIEASGRHLLDLINDILDLSKIEAGKLDLSFEVCSLNEICQASLQLTRGMAQQKMQKISLSMQPGQLFVRADKRRLKQMLFNLLNNAVKFTPESGELGMEVIRIESTRQAKIVIWDKGIGINEDDIARLFQPFTQLDSSLSRHYAGTGLGLALVQRMAQLHAGKLEVESSPGQGSRFSLILPLAAETNQPAYAQIQKPDSLQRAVTIEQNQQDKEQLTRYLNNLGIRNSIQTNAENLVGLVAAQRPDFIIIEHNLSEKSGLEILAELRSDQNTRRIPVIITCTEEKRRQAIALGAAGFLVKPFSQEQLRSELEKVFSIKLQPAHNPTLVLVADDNEDNLDLISEFIKSRHFRVEKACNGLELLARAEQTRPGLILVDIQMPEMDGLEAMRRIRAHPDAQLAAIPMIAITALAMPGDRENCLAAGANAYLSKPLQLKELIDTVFSLLGTKLI